MSLYGICQPSKIPVCVRARAHIHLHTMHVNYLCVIDQSRLALKSLIIIPVLWTSASALNPPHPPPSLPR